MIEFIIKAILIILMLILSPLALSLNPELYLVGVYTKYREKATSLSADKTYLFVANKKLLVTMLASDNREISALGQALKRTTLRYHLSIALYIVTVTAVFFDSKGLILVFGSILLLLVARMIYIYRC